MYPAGVRQTIIIAEDSGIVQLQAHAEIASAVRGLAPEICHLTPSTRDLTPLPNHSFSHSFRPLNSASNDTGPAPRNATYRKKKHNNTANSP